MILRLLREHFFAVLALLAIAFLVATIGFYIWGIGYLAVAVGRANGGPAAGAAAQQFNLAAAAKLDYRGIAPATPAAGATNRQ